MEIDNTYIEIDCPWFEPSWLDEHPEFPLVTSLTGAEIPTASTDTTNEEIAA